MLITNWEAVPDEVAAHASTPIRPCPKAIGEAHARARRQAPAFRREGDRRGHEGRTRRPPRAGRPLPDDRLKEMLYLPQALPVLRRADGGALPPGAAARRDLLRPRPGGHARRRRVRAARPRDSLFPTHRDLTAQLTKGLDLNRVMAQFWGRIDGYLRGRDGNSHIGDWDGNRTFAVISHLPIAYPVACGAGARVPACRRPPGRDGDLRRRLHLERPLARGPQLVGGPPAPRRLGRQQQPVRVLDPEPAGVPRADDRRARRRRTACPGVRVDGGERPGGVRGRAPRPSSAPATAAAPR